MKTTNKDTKREIAFGILIFLITILAIKGLIVISQYIGYASYLQADGGTISEIDLRANFDVSHWSALYGSAFSVSFTSTWLFNLSGNTTLTTANNEKFLIFVCFEPGIEHELYYSMVPEASIDFTSLQAATVSDIDTYMNVNPAAFYSGTNTFTSTASFDVGQQSILAPATYTFRLSEPGNSTAFVTGALKDTSGNLVFVSKILNTPIEGFSSSLYNFQTLLPIRNAASQEYYVWSDPEDQCPAGEGASPFTGYAFGNVTDSSGNNLEGVIVDVAGQVNLSENITGSYTITEIPEGTYNIYAIKTGYKTYKSNITIIRGNGTEHNIVMIAEQPPNPPLTGVGPGEDAAGTKTETGVDAAGTETHTKSSDYDLPPVLQRPKKIEGTDYIISISEINRKLRLGNFLQEKVTLYSFKEKTANLFFTLEGNITNIVKIDKESMILASRSSDFVTVTMFGVGEPGLYNGSLHIDGDFNATIPITIEILQKDQLPVEALLIDLETNSKTVNPGQGLKFKTDLRNLLTDQQYPVHLLFSVQDLDGKNTVWTYDTNAYIKTSFSIIKTAVIPKDAPPGDYVLRVTADYLGLNSAASTIFKVELPWYKVTLFGPIKVWHAFLFLILLLIGAGVAWDVRRRIEAKKKFHIKVEQSELPKPGPRSIWVGKIAETEVKTYFNVESFMTHCIDAGSTGSGKSVSAQVIIEEMLLKGVAVIVFDPTAQWTGMLRKCQDKVMLSLYPYYGMKPTDARAFNGNIKMITNPRELIDIKKYVKPGEIQVFACHKLDPKEMDIFAANTVRQIFKANFQESRTLKVIFVYDEVHRLLPKFGGSGEGFLQIERGCREFRKWGLGILLISQVLSDFVGSIKANINTEIQMRTRDEGDLERIRVKYGEDVLRSLVKATIGSGMVENPQYNRGKPYFIAFKPLMHNVQRLSDEEIVSYNEYNDKIDQMAYELDELEKAGVDVFDLKLELKLSLDKVKTGSFNMVQIYLDGLAPRVKKNWDKIGKTPPKLEKMVISEADLKADLDKAKQTREAYEAEQKKNKPAEAEGAAKDVDIYKKDVSPDKLLKLLNGMLVINMASLYDEIAAMKDDIFVQHVNFEKNDFADWAINSVGDAELGELMKFSYERKDMLSLIEFRKTKKPLPKLDDARKKKYEDAKAAWLAAKKAEEEAKKKKDGEKGGLAPPAAGAPAGTAAPTTTVQTPPSAPPANTAPPADAAKAAADTPATPAASVAPVTAPTTPTDAIPATPPAQAAQPADTKSPDTPPIKT